jgi:hypothetical protein
MEWLISYMTYQRPIMETKVVYLSDNLAQVSLNLRRLTI